MVNKEYKAYKRFKNSLYGITYKGYPLDRVAGSYLAIYAWNKRFRLLFSYLLQVVSNKLHLKSMPVLLTYTFKREDYFNLMRGYYPDQEGQSVSIVTSKLEMFRFVNLMQSFYYAIKALIFLLKNKKFNNIIVLLPFVSYSMKVIDELESMEISCDKYVAFNSSFKIESFITFYFRKRGICTYSLQHGMYFNYIGKIPMDVINYENCCADNLLCWGGYTISQIKNLVPLDVSLRLSGNPILAPVKKNRIIRNNTIYIMLPRYIYLSASIELLNLLERFPSYEFLVRPHPSIKEEISDFIQEKESFILDNAKLSDIQLREVKFKAVISFNSTSVFEAIFYDQEVLYYDNCSEMELMGFKCFSDEYTLIKFLSGEIAIDSTSSFKSFFYN